MQPCIFVQWQCQKHGILETCFGFCRLSNLKEMLAGAMPSATLLLDKPKRFTTVAIDVFAKLTMIMNGVHKRQIYARCFRCSLLRLEVSAALPGLEVDKTWRNVFSTSVCGPRR